MHKYIRKYRGKDGQWVYVYHESHNTPRQLSEDQFKEVQAQYNPTVIEHDELDKHLPIERIIEQQNVQSNPSLPHTDYYAARASSIPNAGEDVLGSARHKRGGKSIKDRLSEFDSKDGPIEIPSNLSAKEIFEHNPIDFFTSLDRLISEFSNAKTQRSVSPLALFYGEQAYRSIPDYKAKLYPTEEMSRSHYKSYLDMVNYTLDFLKTKIHKNYSLNDLYDLGREYTSGLQQIYTQYRNSGLAFDADTYNSLAKNLGVIKGGTIAKQLSKMAHELSDVYKSFLPNQIFERFNEDPRSLKFLEILLDGKGIPKALQHMLTAGTTKPAEKPSSKPKPSAKEVIAKKYKRVGPDYEIEQQSALENVEYATKQIRFRAIQWGNSVTDKEREFHIKALNVAMNDLCQALDLPIPMGSYNGRLAVAIGARGQGAAKAHYESSRSVINLTRTSGIGSLAHEWGHALDNLLCKVVEGKEDSSDRLFLSMRLGFVQSEEYRLAIDAMKNLVKSHAYDVFYSEVNKTIKSVGDWKQRDYLLSETEMFARAFEAYVAEKLKNKGITNTYLVSLPDDDANRKAAYYPSVEVTRKMAPLFDAFFKALNDAGLLQKTELI